MLVAVKLLKHLEIIQIFFSNYEMRKLVIPGCNVHVKILIKLLDQHFVYVMDQKKPRAVQKQNLRICKRHKKETE